MKNVGVVGIGDMGSGLALNLIKQGFSVAGYDLLSARMDAFVAMGGIACAGSAEVGRHSEAVFVMVMNGDEAKEVIFGSASDYRAKAGGLVSTLSPGSIILLSATIKPIEAEQIADALIGTGVDLIDTPVSGGFPGAQGGTLTLMAAGSTQVLERATTVMEAVSQSIHHVGVTPGMGQTVKACLQSLIGSIFSATFEASVLAAKAGVSGEVLHEVVSTSSAGCVVANTALENIIERRFENTGSHIRTMYKDLTISMDVAREQGVPLFTAAVAMQLFQAGITKYPEGDNWSVTRISEDIVNARLATTAKAVITGPETS